MDPNQRFLAAAVQAGLLTPARARDLFARSGGRPAWDVAVQEGALTREAAAQAWRAAQGMSDGTWVGAPSTADDASATVATAPPSADDVSATVATAPPAAARPSAVVAAPPRTALEVTGELGRGGMGRVLRARDRAIGREVAKKVLLDPAAVPPDVRERFLNEARVTGQLEHPSIVPVYEVGHDPTGEPYFVMKLVRGRALSDVLRATRDDPAHADGQLAPLLRQFLKVCDAVAYAHSRGVVHRDLKPQNVMVGDFGEVLVMDWGLARVRGQADPTGQGGAASVSVGASADVTQEGAILGTPAYMPPEQAEGSRDAIDERSDVYALGAILFELLALRPPFVGATPTNIIKQVLMDAPPAPGAVAPPGRVVPRELEAVALKALAKEPGERYASAAALAAEVTRFLEGRPVEALRAGPLRRALKWAARHAELTAAVTAGLVLTSAVAAAGAWRVVGEERARALAEQEARRLAEGKAEQERARAAAEATARRESDERLLVAARRAEAYPAYDRVARFAERELTPEQLRDHVLPSLEEAVEKDPTFAEALLLLGQVRWRLGDAEGARAALLRADEVCRDAAAAAEQLGRGRVPGSPAALLLLGRIAEVEERRDEARALFERAAALDPRDIHSRLARISVVERPDERLELAMKLLDDSPFLPEVVATYAREVSRVEDHEALRTLSRAALEELDERLTEALRPLEPDGVTRAALFAVRSRRGYLRAQLGRHAEALADLRVADELTGHGRRVFVKPARYLDFVVRFAHVLLLTDNEREGLERLDLAGRFQPAEYHVDLLRGQYLLSRGRPGPAADALAAALRKLDALPPGQGLECATALCQVVAAAEAGRPAEAALGARRLLARPLVAFEPYLPLPDLELRLVRGLGGLRAAGPADLGPALDARLREWLAQDEQQAPALLAASDLEAARRAAAHGLACLDALGDADVARRLNLLGARSVASFRLKDHGAAAADLEACLRLNDRSSPALRQRAAADSFNLAVARALLLAKDGALDAPAREAVIGALEQAAALGFDRPDAVRAQPALASVLDDPRVQAALAAMQR